MIRRTSSKVGALKRHVPLFCWARHIKHLWSPKEVEYCLLSRNLAYYDAFVDIGANLGIYSYLFSRSRADVFAFEPNPFLYDYLQTLLGRRVQVVNAAVSSSSTVLRLYVPQHEVSSGRSSVELATARRYSEELIGYDVEAVRLDEIVRPEQYGRLFIKIDVEGHEYSVIEGCANLLHSTSTVDLMVEIDADHNANWRDVFRFLEGYGYHAFYYDKIIKRVPVEHTVDELIVRRTELDQKRVDNFLFSKVDLSEKLR